MPKEEVKAESNEKSGDNEQIMQVLSMLLQTLNDIIEVAPNAFTGGSQDGMSATFRSPMLESERGSDEYRQTFRGSDNFLRGSIVQNVLFDIETQTDKLKVQDKQVSAHFKPIQNELEIETCSPIEIDGEKRRSEEEIINHCFESL